MKLGPFQEVILESSSVEELKEKVILYLTAHFTWRLYVKMDLSAVISTIYAFLVFLKFGIQDHH